MPKNPLLAADVQDMAGNRRYPVSNPTTAATAEASTATLTKAVLTWANITNTGAGGSIVLTLPYANTCGLIGFRVYIAAAQQVSLSPQATDKIYLAGNGVANKDLVIAGVIGNYADIYSDGTYWTCWAHSGVVTKEA